MIPDSRARARANPAPSGTDRRGSELLDTFDEDVHMALARSVSERLDRLVLRGAPPGLGLLPAGELDDHDPVRLQAFLQYVGGATASQEPPAELLRGGRDGSRVLLEFGQVEHLDVRDHVRCHCRTSFDAVSIPASGGRVPWPP